MFDEQLLEQDAVFRVGRVISVDGRRIQIAVDKLKNGSHLLFRGGIVRNVSVGSYVKIVKGFSEMIAKVDGEVVREDRTKPSAYKRGTDPLARELEVSLVGFLERGRFERGIREMPLLDNECFILTEAEFGLINNFVGSDDVPLRIGCLAMEPNQAVVLGVDAIFASHIGIFGNTGSGKSYTLAKLYHELFNVYAANENFRQRSQFVLIDFNGEYIDRAEDQGDVHATEVITAKQNKREYALTTRSATGPKLPLPKSAVEDVTFWTVLLEATEKTQAPFIARVLSSDYWDRQLSEPAELLRAIARMVQRATRSNDIAIDRQTVLNLLGEIGICLGSAASAPVDALIDDFQENLHYNATLRKFYWGAWNDGPIDCDNPRWAALTSDKIADLPLSFASIQPGIDLIRFKIVLQYYSDIISGFSNREHLSPLIKRMETRVPDIKKVIVAADVDAMKEPLLVVSLRDVNLAMRKVIPMLLCKHMYEMKKETDPSNGRYLNFIIDEAHNILSLESTRESESWRDYRLETFEEIVKEGRKFGVFVTLASQRPHDISPTIISQLHNYFLHRLVNNLDIQAIEKAVAYLDRVSFESLPILPTGVCILSGASAQIPVMIKVAELPHYAAPNSRTMSVTARWLLPVGADASANEFEVEAPSGTPVQEPEAPPF